MRPLLILAVLAVFPAFGQEDDVGVGEIGGFLGGVFGIGTHFAGGFNFGVPTSRHIVPNFEFSYAPTANTTFRGGGFQGQGNNLLRSRMYDVNGGVRVRFPNRSHAVPYIGAGIGLLRFTSNLESTALTVNTTTSAASNYLAGNLSGGIRYYITGHVGVCPEIKGYLSNKRFVRATLGIFYQFP